MAWTEITRHKYRRDRLRYASHLAELALIEPLLPPPASPWAVGAKPALRSVMNAMLYMVFMGTSGGNCRRSFPPVRSCRTISTRGRATACSQASIMRWSWRRARRPDGRRARLRASSTACRTLLVRFCCERQKPSIFTHTRLLRN
jgi:hypothetical protein